MISQKHRHHPHFGAPAIHLEVSIAVAVLATLYALVDPQLRIGSRWLLPTILVVLFIPIVGYRKMGRHDIARRIGYLSHTISTVAVVGSVVVLGRNVIRGGVDAENLLRDAALLWAANILVFSFWYWQLDGGGPSDRHMCEYEPSDFVFPQSAVGGRCAAGWKPQYFDYLFVAFNTSSAFSPTDTAALTKRVKALMMVQSLVSLVTLAVLGARAINTLR